MDVQMSMVICANCGKPFAITTDLEGRLRECHNTFYCPSGHPQSFLGQTETERLRKKVAALEAAQQQREADLAKRCAVARKSAKKSKIKKPAKSGLR